MVYKQGFNNKKPQKRIKFLLGLMFFMLIAAFSSVAYTRNSSRMDIENDQSSFLDPFSLAMITIENSPGLETLETPVAGSQYLVVTRPPIRIPYKPEYRSQYLPWDDSSNICWYP